MMKYLTEIFTKTQVLIGVLYFLIGHLFIMPAILFLVFGEDNPEVLGIVHILIITIIMVILVFKNLKSDFSRFIKNGITLLWLIPLLYVIQLVGRMVVTIFMLIIHGDISMGDNQEIVEDILNQFPLLMAFATVVLAPIWEEIFFTGFIFGGLRRKNRFLAYGVTSILFGLLHTVFAFIFNFSPTLFLVTLMYVPLSIVCCYVYEKTDSLWSAIALHAFSNFTAVMLLFLI